LKSGLNALCADMGLTNKIIKHLKSERFGKQFSQLLRIFMVKH